MRVSGEAVGGGGIGLGEGLGGFGGLGVRCIWMRHRRDWDRMSWVNKGDIWVTSERMAVVVVREWKRGFEGERDVVLGQQGHWSLRIGIGG